MSAPGAVAEVCEAGDGQAEEVAAPPRHRTSEQSRVRSVLALALGHASADFYPGYLPTVLPYLIAKLGFSLTVAGGLASLQSFSTSLIQPVLGYLVDARHPRPYAAWGLVIAAVLFSLLGLAPNVAFLALFITVGGLGVASTILRRRHVGAAGAGARRHGDVRLPLAVVSGTPWVLWWQ